MKGLQKERWFLDADDNVDSHRNLIITFFSPYTVFLAICMQIHSVVFALKVNKITNKNMRKRLISFAQAIKFLRNIKLNVVVNPNPPCVRPCWQAAYVATRECRFSNEAFSCVVFLQYAGKNTMFCCPNEKCRGTKLCLVQSSQYIS